MQAQTGPQLLENRGCENTEDGSVRQWTELGVEWTCETSGPPAVEGASYFGVSEVNLPSGTQQALEQHVSVQGGTTYTFFGRLHTQGGDEAGFDVVYLDGEGTPIDSFTTGDFFSNVISTNGEWQTTTHVEELPETTETVSVKLLVNNADGSTNTDVSFDDLRFLTKTQVVEVMQSSSIGAEGQYVEVYNSAATVVDLEDWTLNGESLGGITVPPRNFAVLCATPNADQNGGVETCDNQDELSLGDGDPLDATSDTLVLRTPNGLPVDSIGYDTSGDWPSPDGAALVFANTTGTDNGTHWAAATRRERGFRLDESGDNGSPGRGGTDQVVQPRAEIDAGGWQMLSAPVPGVNADTLAQVSLVQGVSGHFPDAAPNLYRWPGGEASGDGSDDWDASFGAEAGLTDAGTGNGMGFIWYVFDTAETPKTDTPPFALSVPGAVRTTDTTTVSLSGGDGTNSAFHLLGNPYGRSFDLNGLNLEAQGFQATVQIWDPSAQSYETATGGDLVSAYQGFFVEKQSSGNATLTFAADQRDDTSTDLRATTEEPTRIDFRLTGRSEAGDPLTRDDALTLRAHPGATLGWDVHDASKLTPLADAYATAAFEGPRADATVLQSVRSVPSSLPKERVELPVSLTTSGAGAVDTFTLSWPDALSIPGDWAVTLHDTVVDTTVNLRTDASYSFSALTVPMGDAAPTDGRTGERLPPRPHAPRPLRASAAPEGRSLQPHTATDSARFVLALESSTIPVELVDLAAIRSGDRAELRWTTATETNNAGFAVEHRGANAESFERLGFVDGEGTTDQPQDYRYRTDPLSVGRHTFRLRQVDADGDEHTSRTVTVRVGLDGPYRARIRPHPLTDHGTLTLTVGRQQRVEVTLYDVLGRRVGTVIDEDVLLANEPQTVRLRPDQQGLRSGTYFLRITGETFSGTERLVVVR